MYNLVLAAVLGSGIIILIIAKVDARSRINDYLRTVSFLGAAVLTMDLISDCFFIILLENQSHIYIDKRYEILVYVAVISVAVSVMIGYIQLVLDARIKNKLCQSAFITIIFIITTNGFSSILLLNSGLFGLDIFDMKLSDRELVHIYAKRIFPSVLFQNIPQLMIQIYYVSFHFEESFNLLILSSVTFTLISVFTTIAAIFLQKIVHARQNTVIVSMNVNMKGDSITNDMDKYKMMKTNLEQRLGELKGVDIYAVYVTKPRNIVNGVSLMVHVYLNKIKSGSENTNASTNDAQQILRALNESNDTGELSNIFKNSWQLSETPSITDVQQITAEFNDKTQIDSDAIQMSIQMHTQFNSDTAEQDINEVEIDTGSQGERMLVSDGTDINCADNDNMYINKSVFIVNTPGLKNRPGSTPL